MDTSDVLSAPPKSTLFTSKDVKENNHHGYFGETNKDTENGSNGIFKLSNEQATGVPKQTYEVDETLMDASEEDSDADSALPQVVSTTADKVREMDRLIYELVQEEKQDSVRNAFETTSLKAVTLKSKLDMKIDQTILALQNLKNLRRHL